MSGVNTKLLHDYPVIDEYTGSASIPKYQTSTFDQKRHYVDCQKFSYSRFGNPTVAALEEAICCLEGSTHGFAFASGMAAISAVLMLLKQGEHVIFPHEVYGGTSQFATEILPAYGIEVSFVDMSNLECVKACVQDNTKMLYLESPSNPLLKITDIKAMVALGKEHEMLTVIDNTFMTGIYQNSLELGCDIVMESMTKFINGHSDVVAGLVATNDDAIAERLCLYKKNFGALLGVEDAWLVLRGIKTMGLRMDKAASNALLIAQHLQQHSEIECVYYPGLKNHPDHDIHTQQASSGGCILSFKLNDKYCYKKFANALKIPIFAVSLGGVESILSHPASMSHACLSEEQRISQGVTNNLLRLSCGIEDVEDLIEDINQALIASKKL